MLFMVGFWIQYCRMFFIETSFTEINFVNLGIQKCATLHLANLVAFLSCSKQTIYSI